MHLKGLLKFGINIGLPMMLMSCSSTQVIGINDCIAYQPIYPIGKAYQVLRDDNLSIQIFKKEIATHNAVWESRCK